MVANEIWFGKPTSYSISNSCIFDANASAYMSRTPGSAGNRKTMTQSMWVKRAKLGTDQTVGINTAEGLGLWFNADNTMTWYCHYDSGWEGKLTTTQVFRDPSAWYHLVTVVDTTQAVAANRAKIYVNGSQVTAFSLADYPDQNDDTAFNAAAAHSIGIWLSTPSYYYDGYIAEMHWIDGTSLTPSSFGETNNAGVWVPKKYTGGSYGTTGFFLDFAAGGDLGDDESGQGNDWAETNIAAANQTTDTPTDNHCIFNPTYFPDRDSNQTDSMVLTKGSLTASRRDSSNNGFATGTLAVYGGSDAPKIYWELTPSTWAAGSWVIVGWEECVTLDVQPTNRFQINGRHTTSAYELFQYPGGDVDPYSSITQGVVIGVAYDFANDAIAYYADGSEMFSYDSSGLAGLSSISLATFAGKWWRPVVGNANDGGAAVLDVNFGQKSFAQTVPTGYVGLSTAALQTPAVSHTSTYFQTELYTGNGTAIGSGGKAVTFSGNVNLEPDLVWIKNRDQGDSHSLYDSVRGTTKQIEADNNAAETTESEGLTTFGSDGFTVGSLAQVNTNTENYAAWSWKEATTSGFDIVTYTGNGSARTISHSLGIVPNFIIVKNRSAADAWKVYHSEAASDPQTDYFVLNAGDAAADDATVWNDTAPTNSVFSLGAHTDVNTNTENYVAYLWGNIPQFQMFGKYVGNGSADGSFVWTGFRPQLIILKHSSAGEGWAMYDASINPYNSGTTTGLTAFRADETGTQSSNENVDLLSNGFKLKNTNDPTNDGGDTYIFAAWAASPFGGSGISPATAR